MKNHSHTRYSQFAKTVFKMLVSCCLLLNIAACDEPSTSQPLRVSSNNWPGYEPFFLAEKLNFYPDNSIHLIETPASVVLTQSLQAGTIDAAAVSLSRALNIQSEGLDISIVLVLDWSNGADQIVVRTPYSSINDLAGKRIAAEPHTVNMFLLLRALEMHGMSIDDVEVLALPDEKIVPAFENNEIDGASIFATHLTKLKGMGAKTVFDSSQIPGEIIDVLIVRNQYLEQNSDKVKNLIIGWLRGLKYLQANKNDPAFSAEIMNKQDFNLVQNQVTWAGQSENSNFLKNNGEMLKETIQNRLKTFGTITHTMKFSEVPTIAHKPFEAAVTALKDEDDAQ